MERSPAQETANVGIALASKTRWVPATPLEMALRLEREQAKGAGMLMPDPDRQVRLSGGVIQLDGRAEGFPSEFLERLVPVEINGVEAWHATLRTDDASGDILFYNSDEEVFWAVAADAALWSADWIARLHSRDGKAENFFDTEQVLLTLSEKPSRVKVSEDALYRSAWVATRQYFLPSHVEMAFTFIRKEDINAYRSASMVTRLPGATVLSMSAPLTGLTVTGFVAGTNGAALSAAWPTDTAIAGDALDIFFTRTLIPPAWTNLLRVAVDPAANGLDIVIPRSELPPAPEATPAACVTNIVQSAYDPGVMVTNIVCTNAVWLTDSGFFRLADLGDTDTDGLTDAYEKWVSLTGPYDPDSDGDGLTDGEETALGTKPLEVDSDGDGLADGVEASAVFGSDSGPVWFDVAGGMDLTAAVYGNWAQVSQIALPFAVSMSCTNLTHVSVAGNGCVGLSGAEGGLWWGWPDNGSLESLKWYNHGPLAVVGFWDRLGAYQEEMGSTITLADVATNGHRYCVIEYRNMGFLDIGPSTNDTVSFQIVLAEGVTNRVAVLYRDVRGLGDGRSATLGVQADRYTLLYARDATNAVCTGMALAYQIGFGTNPGNGDTDDDDLSDDVEISLGSDPLDADTDGDGLDDGAEVALGTDLFDDDTDGDGLTDGEEAALETDPLSPHSDGDGMPDGWEVLYGFNPLCVQTDGTHGPDDDLDNDGLTNLREFSLGTLPTDADTDDDGLTDGAEAGPGPDIVEWGRQYEGTDAVMRPTDLPDLVSVSAGFFHVLAVCRDGTVACWGKNDGGQCSPIEDLTNAVAAAAGAFHSVALRADGTVVCWGGTDTYGERTPPAAATNVTAVAAGGFHSAALRADGTLICWGMGFLGQTVVPTGLTNAVAVAAGALHTAALTSNGRVSCWGYNSVGQTNAPPNLTNAVAVATGSAHTAVLTADGRVVCWGDNSSGQTNAPPGLTNAVAVGAGRDHTLACTARGEVICWGDNEAGQAEGRAFTNAPVRYLGGGAEYSLALVGISPRFTDPLNPDTDGDGLGDGWEDRYGFDPLTAQTDGAHGADDDPDDDGLTNLEESGYGVDPFDDDTDDDDLKDGDEADMHGTNPSAADTDGDGLGDSEEIGLQAVYPCLDPCLFDSDGDMLPDGWEISHGLRPCDYDGALSSGWDADGDGLGLFDEYRYCTDPADPDTDGDGVSDGVEIPHSPGSCPTDADDGGDPANCVTIKLTVGDPSGSNSERWNLEIFEDGLGAAVVRHCDDGFGTPGSAEYALAKGKSYTFKLRWIATNLEYGPDYDWQTKINDSTAAGAREGLYGTGAFIVEDPDALLTGETHGDDTNITLGKEGKIIVPKVEIVGQDKAVTWPCACVESRVIIAANVVPSTTTDNIRWMASCLVDNEARIMFLPCQITPPDGTPSNLHGADFYAVFTPPINYTAEFTISLTVDDYPMTENTSILVHAVPNGKSTSTSIWLEPPTKPYGRAYKHTFTSSGGNLGGVRISERVTFANDPYAYQNANIAYGESIWDLDSTGVMDEYDEYNDPYDMGQININRFHPVPPGTGTPVIFHTLQTYGWECPLCSTYHDFFSHEIYTGLSSYDESHTVPKYQTATSGTILFDEDYLGNPFLHVDDVFSSALTVVANGSNTFQVGWSGTHEKASNPLAQDLNWSWDCSATLGCTFSSLYDNPMTVITGTESGTLELWINLNPIRSTDPTFKAYSISIQLTAP